MDHVTVVPIVSNEDDAIVAPLQPHEISRCRIVLTLEDRDDFAAFEPGGRQPDVIEPGVSVEEHADVLRSASDRMRRLHEFHIIGEQRAQARPIALIEQRDVTRDSVGARAVQSR